MKAWQVWALQSRLARWSHGQEPRLRPKATSYEFWRLCELGRVLSPLRPTILDCKCDQHFTAPGIILWYHLPSEIYTEGPTRWIGEERYLLLKSDNLNSNPGTYTVEGQNWPLHVILWCSHVHDGTYVPMHMYTYVYTDDRYTHKQKNYMSYEFHSSKLKHPCWACITMGNTWLGFARWIKMSMVIWKALEEYTEQLPWWLLYAKSDVKEEAGNL